MVRAIQREGRTVGLVPTMGALHAGHMSLIAAAAARCDVVAVTIFVNPLQFSPDEDLARYPRTLDADLEACRNGGVSLVFAPELAAMYPGEPLTQVSVRKMSAHLCGAHRPGHFDGVATVVAKLFNVIPADVAFFGEKDYQQLTIIRRMVADLNMPIEIVGCPTIRAADGLAMSSRNVYLTPDQRRRATSLSRALFATAEAVRRGELRVEALIRSAQDKIRAAGPVEIDYIEIVDASSLEPLVTVDRAARMCLAARYGSCRLIDNVALDAGGLGA